MKAGPAARRTAGAGRRRYYDTPEAAAEGTDVTCPAHSSHRSPPGGGSPFSIPGDVGDVNGPGAVWYWLVLDHAGSPARRAAPPAPAGRPESSRNPCPRKLPSLHDQPVRSPPCPVVAVPSRRPRHIGHAPRIPGWTGARRHGHGGARRSRRGAAGPGGGTARVRRGTSQRGTVLAGRRRAADPVRSQLGRAVGAWGHGAGQPAGGARPRWRCPPDPDLAAGLLAGRLAQVERGGDRRRRAPGRSAQHRRGHRSGSGPGAARARGRGSGRRSDRSADVPHRAPRRQPHRVAERRRPRGRPRAAPGRQPRGPQRLRRPRACCASWSTPAASPRWWWSRPVRCAGWCASRGCTPAPTARGCPSRCACTSPPGWPRAAWCTRSSSMATRSRTSSAAWASPAPCPSARSGRTATCASPPTGTGCGPSRC